MPNLGPNKSKTSKVEFKSLHTLQKERETLKYLIAEPVNSGVLALSTVSGRSGAESFTVGLKPHSILLTHKHKTVYLSAPHSHYQILQEILLQWANIINFLSVHRFEIGMVRSISESWGRTIGADHKSWAQFLNFWYTRLIEAICQVTVSSKLYYHITWNMKPIRNEALGSDNSSEQN